MSRPRVVSIYVAAVLFLMGALAVVTFIQVRHSQSEIRMALRELDQARSELSLPALQREGNASVSHLRAARAHLLEARAGLASPWLAPARAFPFAGRQLRASVALASGAASATDAAIEMADQVPSMLREASPDRVVPLLGELQAALNRFDSRLATITLPSPAHLLSPLRKASIEFSQQLSEARARVARLEQLLPTLKDMVGEGEPRHYFLAINNNAEMRAAGGMTLEFGILSFDSGRFHLDDVKSFTEIGLPDGSEGIPLPDGYREAFGWMKPGKDIRNTGVSAFFPEVAALAVRMYEARNDRRLDGVISVDVVALQTVVGVLGPIDVPELGEAITGENAARVLLSDAYARFADDKEARRRVLGLAASAVTKRLSAGGYEYGPLVQGLGQSVQQRHLMLWSARPEEEVTLERTGLTGSFPTDRFPIAAAVQNIGANKLDYYLDSALDLDLQFVGREVIGTLTITIANPVKVEGLPTYVVGPNDGLDVPPGMYHALVSVWLPGGTAILPMEGEALSLHRGSDAGYSLINGYVEIPADTSAKAVVRFSMRLGADQSSVPLAVLPQPRIRPVPLRVTTRLGPGWSGPSVVGGPGDATVLASWLLK